MKPRRLLKNIRVQFISLVDRPANRKKIIAKSEDFDEENAVFSKEVKIEKIDEEKRVVYGIVYAPGEVDAHGDTTTAEEIEKALERFMLEGRTRYVDKNHDYQPDEGFVREAWIVKEGDPLFDEVGAWAVGIKVTNDETWQQIKKGEITGISFAGWAEVEPIEVEKKEPKWVVQPLQNLPFADPDTPWSFTAADADAIIEKYGWQGMKKAHLVVDVSEGPVPKKKTAYKFPIAKIIDGRLKIVPRAIFAAAAYLQGARGVEVNLPEDVKEKLRKRLAQYYHKLDRKAPWEEKSLLRKIGEFFGLIEKKEVEEVNREELKEVVEEILKERLESFEKSLKEVSGKIEEIRKSLSERLEKLEKSDEIGNLKEELKKLSEDVALLKSTIISKAQEQEKEKKEESIFKGIL